MNNLFVVSHLPGKLFSLDTFTFVDNDAPREVYDPSNDDYHAYNLPGCGNVLKKENGVYTLVELTEDEKEAFTENDELSKVLRAHIVAENTGKIVYDVAWWACPFNLFQQGFSLFHFEV
jgi:hypothetical protein